MLFRSAMLIKELQDNRSWVVYLVRCSDQSLYCGVTNNLKKRLAMHNNGKGARYTRSRRPVTLAGVCENLTKRAALRLEHRIKKLPSDKKLEQLENEKETVEEHHGTGNHQRNAGNLG